MNETEKLNEESQKKKVHTLQLYKFYIFSRIKISCIYKCIFKKSNIYKIKEKNIYGGLTIKKIS